MSSEIRVDHLSPVRVIVTSRSRPPSQICTSRLGPTTTTTLLRHIPQVLAQNMAESGIGIPISTVKLHKPYFTPQQVQDLCEKTRGKLSVSQEEKVRQQACTFIEAVGAKIGL